MPTTTGTREPSMGLTPTSETCRTKDLTMCDNSIVSASSCAHAASPTRKECRGSNSTPLRRRHDRERRRSSRTNTKNCYLSAILLVMVIDCLQPFQTLQFLDAFRMVRYRYPTKTKHGYNLCHDTSLFATPNNSDNQQQQQQQQQTSVTTKDPFEATGQDNELFKTLAGGSSLIFEMARKSMLFATKEADAKPQQSVNGRTSPSTTSDSQAARPQAPPQGRWYPHSGIAGVNPNFRTQAPAMTNQGFARSIWKNARKRNKPSLWKHALRTYERMALLEGDPNFSQIRRANIHHEGAMQACAKLGLWQRALEIYHFVYQEEVEQQPNGSGRRSGSKSKGGNKSDRAGVYVTDDMVLSLVRATVRASRLRSRNKRNSHDPPLSPEQEEQEAALRRIPLDTALEILSRLTEDHGIPLVAYYLNPLAAAYQRLGYTAMSKEILETMLSNRTAGEDEILNVHDLCAKDKGSYSLLVQASVVTGDWGAAVDSLNEMTNAGLYPNPRHCNMWSEISERQTRPRAVGSWKKKRDDFWTDSIR